jgi:hypothetical protein
MASQARHVRRSKRALGALCAVVLAGSLTAAFAGSASATTAPGYIYTIRAIITDKQVVLVQHRNTGKYFTQFVRSGGHSAQFPRGAAIEFLFINKGTKTYLPAIRVIDKSQADPYTKTKNLYLAPKQIKPGGHVSLFGNFYFRGAFRIETLFHKKPQGKTVDISIY